MLHEHIMENQEIKGLWCVIGRLNLLWCSTSCLSGLIINSISHMRITSKSVILDYGQILSSYKVFHLLNACFNTCAFVNKFINNFPVLEARRKNKNECKHIVWVGSYVIQGETKQRCDSNKIEKLGSPTWAKHGSNSINLCTISL